MVSQDSLGDYTRTGGPSYHEGPGSSLSFRVKVAWDGTLCEADEATDLWVKLYHWNGTGWDLISSKDETGVNLVTLGQIDIISGHWDSLGFGTSTGTALSGQWYVGLSLVGNAEDGASTEGGVPTSAAVASSYTKGYFSTGYMAGLTTWNPNRTQSQNQTELDTTDTNDAGKAFPVTRVYDTNFEAPCSVDPCGQGNVKANIDEGRLVIFSNQAGGMTNLGNCPAGGTCSQWASVANGNQDTTLSTILSDLNTWATDSGAAGEVIYSFSHEPWKHATENSCSTCYGSSEDYRAAYAHIHDLLSSYPHVRLMYIPVSSKGVLKATGGPIGSGDLLYAGNNWTGTSRTTILPCSLSGATYRACDPSFVDLLGPDVYNYYAYQSSTWRPLTYWLIDPNQGVITLGKQWQKHVLIAELGSHPGCTGSADNGKEGCTATATSDSGPTTEVNTDWKSITMTRDGWFLDGKETMANNSDVETWLLGFVYYHVNNTSGGHNMTFFGNTSNNDDYGDCGGPHEPSQTGCPGTPNSTGWTTAFATNSWFLAAPIAS